MDSKVYLPRKTLWSSLQEAFFNTFQNAFKIMKRYKINFGVVCFGIGCLLALGLAIILAVAFARDIF